MYGECSGGNDNAALEKYFANPEKAQFSCIHGDHYNCDVKNVKECTGTADYDFFYEIVEGKRFRNRFEILLNEFPMYFNGTTKIFY